MLGRCIVVNLVTTDAGDVAAMNNHVARVVDNVIFGLCKVHLKVGEQVVASHEIVGVGKTARFALASAQMALPANGDDLFGILGMLLREPDERCVVGMVFGRDAVAGKAIERRRGEGVSLRVDRRCMTAGATLGEFLCVPRFAVD